MYQLTQGYMQAVGGVGRSGGTGKANNFSQNHWPFFQEKMAVKKIVQKAPLSPLLSVNGLPLLPCGELFIRQQSRWILYTRQMPLLCCKAWTRMLFWYLIRLMNLFSFSDNDRIQGCHPNANGGDKLLQLFALSFSGLPFGRTYWPERPLPRLYRAWKLWHCNRLARREVFKEGKWEL